MVPVEVSSLVEPPLVLLVPASVVSLPVSVSPPVVTGCPDVEVGVSSVVPEDDALDVSGADVPVVSFVSAGASSEQPDERASKQRVIEAVLK